VDEFVAHEHGTGGVEGKADEQLMKKQWRSAGFSPGGRSAN